MKVGPVLRALDGRADVALVHTGQHYDRQMSLQFFDELRLPHPDVDLGVGSGTHARQTAGVMVAFEKYILADLPEAVVVVGDVNSTLACALTAVKLNVPVAHVEAGLRSGDWTMPEEINRVLTDRISRWLFTPSEDADDNLLAEGIPADQIHCVGNVMIDTLLVNLPRARERAVSARKRLGLSDRFGLVTLHRPSNVDEARQLTALMGALGEISRDVPLVFPVHPRTEQQLQDLGVPIPNGLKRVEPLGYLDFIGLLDAAALVLTDSGGVQEEASVLGVPCLTLRQNTERPITCKLGTNRILGTDSAAIATAAAEALERHQEPAAIPLWDGKAGMRIADVLVRDLLG
ncbi:MAG: UDP-N-acetylglucosamine 2-epimerase (non-hydrolyzing) [Actinobacteria bacterium]|nr:UDP-N-acetylglucosamine 2-epimerase (non-hydrolyzing) [Actinomycetota bacterium]